MLPHHCIPEHNLVFVTITSSEWSQILLVDTPLLNELQQEKRLGWIMRERGRQQNGAGILATPNS